MSPRSTTHPTTWLGRGLIASIAALVLPLSLSSFAVADDEPSSPKSWNIAVGSEAPGQAIQRMSFPRASIYVNVGDTITSETSSTEIRTVAFPARGQWPKPFSPSVGTAAVPAERLIQAAPPYGALRKQLNAIIATYPQYQLGVALIDMSDGVIHTYGVQGKFVAASTAKILAAGAYYHYAERGLLSLTAPMGGHTAAYQIHQMIQQSNNQSWALILGALGNQRIHDYAAALGISYYRTLNELSPAETATLLYLLYTGRLITTAHANQLLSYMQHTNYETLIPAAVPPAITVFHKYGLLNGYLHDASILVQSGRAYAFVVYTLGRSMADIPARTGVIHKLTRAVVEKLF
ncbi:serine hydrolase [Arthrobacter sp. OAP107]|uniref:serine hydrolase n=1 Tax=Arthrobacter sp. OAP107 TaxID=3156445 RepID=UPI0033969091